MVQDLSSLRTEQTISTASGQWVIMKIKYVHLKHLKSTGLYGAQLVHILTTLLPLCTGLSMIPRVGTCTKLAAKIQDTPRKGLELTLAVPNDYH